MKSLFPKSRIRFLPIDEKGIEENGENVRPEYVDGFDSTPLALYKFFPSFEPDKVLIFYHDAGIYQCPQYREMAQELSHKYNIGVYLAEMRGHGFSGGRTEALTSGEILLDDIEAVVRYVSSHHLKARLYLGAHSQTCALLAYYGSLRHPAPISGFVMIAPYFGPFSIYSMLQLKKGNIKPPLNHMNVSTWMMHYLSGGTWCKNQPVWQFESSVLIGARDPRRVSRYNSEMARFMNVFNIKEILGSMGAPFFALLPARDERTDLDRLKKEMQYAVEKVPHSHLFQAKEGDFISLLSSCAGFISKQTTLQTAIF